MEQPGLGRAEGHVLDGGDLSEGQALDEVKLCGEPLVGRQRGKGLVDGNPFVGNRRKGLLHLACRLVAPPVLRAAYPVDAAPPQDAESPRGKA